MTEGNSVVACRARQSAIGGQATRAKDTEREAKLAVRPVIAGVETHANSMGRGGRVREQGQGVFRDKLHRPEIVGCVDEHEVIAIGRRPEALYQVDAIGIIILILRYHPAG